MAAPYTSVSVSGYNSNPPADDGSAVAANQILWATIKAKLGDPLNTFASGVDSNISSAFQKVVGGAGVTSTATGYTVQSADQGKLIRVTGSGGITLTTPDASDVTAPFVFAYVNDASSSITLDGNGSQTVNGNASLTIAAGAGGLCFTDGSNWFTTGQIGALVGAQMNYSEMINLTVTESNATNAVTFAIKTLAGTDPTTADPVLLAFRNATAGNGNFVYRSLTSALSLTISAGSTLGTTNNTAFRVWLVLFDDGGTIRLGAINCLNGANIYPLGRHPIASSTTEGGAGGADSAQVFYTGTGVTSKPYLPVAYCSYESGLSTAGNWNVSPTTIQLVGHSTKMPGDELQIVRTTTGAVSTSTNETLPLDDTIPASGEGASLLSQAITPVSGANIIHASFRGFFSMNDTASLSIAMFQDSAAAMVAANERGPTTNQMSSIILDHYFIAGTTSATTIDVRQGRSGTGTTTFNGTGGSRLFGGVANTFLVLREIMA